MAHSIRSKAADEPARHVQHALYLMLLGVLAGLLVSLVLSPPAQ